MRELVKRARYRQVSHRHRPDAGGETRRVRNARRSSLQPLAAAGCKVFIIHARRAILDGLIRRRIANPAASL